MTLTEFLLARIADDEAGACDCGTFDGGHPGDCALFSTQGKRVLAECEAKRRIVERLTSPDPHLYGEPCNDCATLYDLASVYDTHPDYREEWKP